MSMFLNEIKNKGVLRREGGNHEVIDVDAGGYKYRATDARDSDSKSYSRPRSPPSPKLHLTPTKDASFLRSRRRERSSGSRLHIVLAPRSRAWPARLSFSTHATTTPVVWSPTDHRKVPIAHTCRASPAQGISNAQFSQVATSIKTDTTPTQHVAVQEDRVSEMRTCRFDAESLPVGAGGLPLLRGSLRIVSAVQELATAHGEELELDGWDAEEGGHVGHQISGTSTCDIDNEDVRAKDVPKFLHWFLTDETQEDFYAPLPPAADYPHPPHHRHLSSPRTPDDSQEIGVEIAESLMADVPIHRDPSPSPPPPPPGPPEDDDTPLILEKISVDTRLPSG